MERCYCKRELADGDRKLVVSLDIDWGAKDLREKWSGEATACSFACLAKWATDRALEHDDRVLVDGVHEAYGNEEVSQ